MTMEQLIRFDAFALPIVLGRMQLYFDSISRSKRIINSIKIHAQKSSGMSC